MISSLLLSPQHGLTQLWPVNKKPSNLVQIVFIITVENLSVATAIFAIYFNLPDYSAV